MHVDMRVQIVTILHDTGDLKYDCTNCLRRDDIPNAFDLLIVGVAEHSLDSRGDCRLNTVFWHSV